MKANLVVWMNMPSHHQYDYFQELSKLCQLRVNYTGRQENRRKSDGWITPDIRNFEKYKTFFLWQLLSLVKHRKATHIITGCGSSSNILLWLFCQLLNISWCHLSEDIPTDKHRSFLKTWIIKCYYNSINTSAVCAFAIGNKARQSFEFFNVKSEKIRLTNYSSAINSSSQIKGQSTLPLKALVLGEVSPHKGSDILLNIIGQFSKQISVDFYGSIDKTNNHLSLAISEQPNTQYLGIIASDKVSSLWARYDFLIFPSRTDGWGMAVHEAIANNVPVVCSKAAGCSEHLIIDGFNGLIISPTEKSLSTALNQYITDPNLIHLHSVACKRYKEKFSPHATASQFIQNISLHSL